MGIWVGVSFALELFFPFFKTGPFARQGLVNFWIEFFLWFFWIVFVTVGILKAIRKLEAEAADGQREIASMPQATRYDAPSHAKA
jgi:hypothetical protein